MKIVLRALGTLESQPMDVPENTGSRWKMVLRQPLTKIIDYGGNEVRESGPFQTMCEFEWTGKNYLYGGGISARIYELVDIHKLPNEPT